MSVVEAITEEQRTIILKSIDSKYPRCKSISDIDLIADLTELKIKIRKERR